MAESFTEIDVPENRLVSYAQQHGAWYAAFRVLEFVLAEDTPQEQVTFVMHRLANQLAFAPELAAEVRSIGKDVATVPPARFAMLQQFASEDHSIIGSIAS